MLGSEMFLIYLDWYGPPFASHVDHVPFQAIHFSLALEIPHPVFPGEAEANSSRPPGVSRSCEDEL